MKGRLGFYPSYEEPRDHQRFYQQAFTRADFRTELHNAGFELREFHGGPSLIGIRREFGPIVRWALSVGAVRKMARSLDLVPGAKMALGHMAMYVARKRVR